MSIQQLPNMITFLRIIGVVGIFWLTPYTTNFWLLVVVELYTLVCITDFLDGWVARRFKCETYLGKVLDPLADKILVLVFLPLLEMQVITAFPVFIILAREFSIMALRIIAAKEETTIVAAQFSGKLKTAFTLPVCGILLVRVPVETVDSLPFILQPFEWLRLWIISWPNYVINLLVYAVVFVTIWSFFSYFNSYLWKRYLLRFNNDVAAAKRSIRCLIPNTFSVLNLLSGILAIVFSLNGHLNLAVLFILIGIISDSLDGSLARRLDAYSKFGEQLDTKADLVSFGVAPAFFIYSVLNSMLLSTWPIIFALTYFLCVSFRLWRFSQSGHSSTFDGLPSPIAAGLIIFASQVNFLDAPFLFPSIVIYVSILMVTTLSFPHLSVLSRGKITRKIQSVSYVFSIISMIALLGLHEAKLLFPFDVIFFIVMSYSVCPFWYKVSSPKD